MTPADLRVWRQSHGWTQRTTAALFGVPQRTYQRWEQDGYGFKGAAQRLALLLHDEGVLAKALAVVEKEQEDASV